MRKRGKRLRLLLLGLGGAALMALVAWRWMPGDWRLALAERAVRARFPEVPQLAPESLAVRLAAEDPPLLLDIRSAEEFAVSHLPGALHVPPDSAWLPGTEHAGRELVAYCSLGWRSSHFVARLRKAGVPAANLEGSIFRWALEGRPLARGAETVSVVHPYAPAWEHLVPAEQRRYAP